jgi:hypothetical protein
VLTWLEKAKPQRQVGDDLFGVAELHRVRQLEDENRRL